ncbi:O-methylsterigmatocystin oxidoreductase [Cytospora mali]|uniref:O-methylsterigmatocystin oxidoreductase n=1 Tax=Cytospora mali TaxID=578113 RepID=A0A194V082_CYTMA|nr:O-methylsterigmatocystin oxidoreductase [Valsa mali var. pyri (nom. inval.)]
MSVKIDIVSTLILGCVAFAASRILQILLIRKKNSHPLPPGPKPWPVVGNIADLPPSGVREWEFWLKHKDLYGPISSVTVFGTTIVVLHSPELAVELLDKRSAIYSSRPRLVFGGEMCGWEYLVATQFYDDRLRTYRRLMHNTIGSKASAARFNALQEVEVHRFLLRLLEQPAGLLGHIRTEAGAIILKLGYGYTINPHELDPLVDIADRALEQFSAATVPGVWLVDTLPFLRYLPEWMPGAGFKKTARQWKATLMELAERPMQFVRKQMVEQHYEPSFVSGVYERAGDKIAKEEEEALKWTAASLYTGGADTSVSVISTFFLAMTRHPEVQRNAQEEIDRVIGTDRLPTFDDRESLTYVEAVIKEAFRMHPIGPMGLPHVTTADDICEGYLIPKGAIILPCIWWFTHDPAVYPHPELFDPSRFLGPNPAPDPRNYVFGFGRRICPGKQFADMSVWLTLVRSLAVFDIKKGLDKTGKEIEPEMKFTPGIISHPEPFAVRITPRSSTHEGLIRQVEKQHPWEKSSADELEAIKFD